jgi:hypothetical protein
MGSLTSPPANDRPTAALAQSYSLEACLRDTTPEYDAETQFRPFVFAGLYRITWVRLYSTLHTNSGLHSLGAVLPADDFLAASNYRGLSKNSPILVMVVGAGYWLRYLVHPGYLFPVSVSFHRVMFATLSRRMWCTVPLGASTGLPDRVYLTTFSSTIALHF